MPSSHPLGAQAPLEGSGEAQPSGLRSRRLMSIYHRPPQEITPGQLSLEDLLEMTDEQVCETVEKYGANQEECARLNASLSCLRNVHMSGEQAQGMDTCRGPGRDRVTSAGRQRARVEDRGAWTRTPEGVGAASGNSAPRETF